MQNKSKSPFKIALSRFIHNKIAMLSIIFINHNYCINYSAINSSFSSEPTRFIKYKR